MKDEVLEMYVNNKGEEDFLFEHLSKDMDVLEWGSGRSTLAIAKRVRSLVSIEHYHGYYIATKKLLNQNKITNVQLLFLPANNQPVGESDGSYEDFTDYINAVNDKRFDLIFVDGRARVACARKALELLRNHSNGLIFIHDYRHPKEIYRRPEYEVVETFLTPIKKVFAMQSFHVSGVNFNSSPQVDEKTCWYENDCVHEMNKFYQSVKDAPYHNHIHVLKNLFMEIETGLQVLDIGCGVAAASKYINEDGLKFDYIGADLPHIVAGCSMKNFPNNLYRNLDIIKDDISWIGKYPVVLMNALIDVMEYPLNILDKILKSATGYVVIHRQEISDKKETQVQKNGSYSGFTYHSIINRKDFYDLVDRNGFFIIKQLNNDFANWEDGGYSFLLRKK